MDVVSEISQWTSVCVYHCVLSLRFKLSSVLPALHLKLSDEKFKMLMKV